MIHLAAEETISNIMRHALNNNPEEHFTVICRNLPTAIEIVIRDKGVPFSPDELPEYNPENLVENGEVEGLGLYLLKQAVDKAIFRNLGRDGHETILIKHLHSKRIDNLIADEVNKTEEIVIKTPGEWRLREFIPSDALEISRCAYRTYGYTYEPYIYYPDSITDMNRKGELQSTVAVNNEEELLAHIALKFHHPDDPVAEVGVAFVKPEYRKYGIFSKLCEHEFKAAKDAGLFGIYGRAVTSHAVSQKKLTQSGFASCGVMLGLFPSDVDFKKLGGRILQKESALLIYLPLNDAPETRLYPPKHHQNIIRKIFKEAGFPSESLFDSDGNPESPLPSGEACMTYNRMEVFNTADILCFAGGMEIVDDIHTAKKKLCLEHTDVLYLYLDLASPDTPQLAEACEKLGFFFSGVLPFGLRGRHALIMQYLNNLAIDFEKITLYDPFAQELLNYVEQCEKR